MIKAMQNLSSPTSSGNANFQNTHTNTDDFSNTSSKSGLSSSPTGGVFKEQEPFGSTESQMIEEVPSDVELEPRLESMGLTKRSETIELPPDVSRMGVQGVGYAQPLIYSGIVQLPLTDDQIVVGLHAQLISSLRWLAEWCIRRLKRAHIHLTNRGGRVVREAL